jgi:hypothetical protein
MKRENPWESKLIQPNKGDDGCTNLRSARCFLFWFMAREQVQKEQRTFHEPQLGKRCVGFADAGRRDACPTLFAALVHRFNVRIVWRVLSPYLLANPN